MLECAGLNAETLPSPAALDRSDPQALGSKPRAKWNISYARGASQDCNPTPLLANAQPMQLMLWKGPLLHALRTSRVR